MWPASFHAFPGATRYATRGVVRSIPARRLLAWALAASVAVHVLVVAAIWSRPHRATKLSDTGASDVGETVLALLPAPPPIEAPSEPAPATPPQAAPPEPPTPEPPPIPEPTPPVAPARAVDRTGLNVSAGAAAPAVPPAPRPREPTSGPATHADTAPSRPKTPEAAPIAPTVPGVSFAGVTGARASRVVYVIDCSGAMASSLAGVYSELLRSVGRLTPAQSFQVVVYRQVAERSEVDLFQASGASGVGMVAPTSPGVSGLRAWLDGFTPSGRSDPMAGLRAAFRLRPDLILLLTRSIKRSNTEWGEGKDAMLAELDRLNPRGPDGVRPVIVKTIQFIDEDPTGLLQQIAAEHGDGPGSYRVVQVIRN